MSAPSYGQIKELIEEIEQQGEYLRELRDAMPSVRLALWILVWIAAGWSLAALI